MITIKSFVFNSFQVNSFVLSDGTGECIIIDPGCNDAREKNELSSYIDENQLKPVALVNTHFHVDHVLGNHFVFERYNLEPTGHKAGKMFWKLPANLARCLTLSWMRLSDRFILWKTAMKSLLANPHLKYAIRPAMPMAASAW